MIPPGTTVVLRGSAVTGTALARWRPVRCRRSRHQRSRPDAGRQRCAALLQRDRFFRSRAYTRDPWARTIRTSRRGWSRSREADGDRRTPGEYSGIPGDRAAVSRRSARPAVSDAAEDLTLCRFRLLTYNIRFGGEGRVEPLARVIRACSPDLVLLQEATRPEVVEQLARTTGMACSGRRSAPVTRLHEPDTAGSGVLAPAAILASRVRRSASGRSAAARVFGVHLSAVHAAWTERRRLYELRALLRAVRPLRGWPACRSLETSTRSRQAPCSISARLPFRLRAVRVAQRREHQVADHPDRPRRRLCGCVSPEASGRSGLHHARARSARSPRLCVRACRLYRPRDRLRYRPPSSDATASDHLPLVLDIDVEQKAPAPPRVDLREIG